MFRLVLSQRIGDVDVNVVDGGLGPLLPNQLK